MLRRALLSRPVQQKTFDVKGRLIMFSIKKQINRLYASAIFGQLSLSGAWVAILAARGFSLAQIGFAETIFHIVSILFEIPSGVQLAILFGLVEVRLSPVAKDFNVWKLSKAFYS